MVSTSGKVRAHGGPGDDPWGTASNVGAKGRGDIGIIDLGNDVMITNPNPTSPQSVYSII